MKKKMKRMAALAMAAAMVVSTPVGAANSATGGEFSGTTAAVNANIFYKQNITDFVVPTTMTVAFNPNKLNMKMNALDCDDEIVSSAVALVSKATKDKKVSVQFNVAAEGINFVSSEDDFAENKGKKNVLLQVVTADGTHAVEAYSGATSGSFPIQASSGTDNKLTVPTADLSHVKMTPNSGTSGTVAIASGTKVGFIFGAAEYEYPDINLDEWTSGSNMVSGTISALGSGTKNASGSWTAYDGISSFKFTGKLDQTVDWFEVGESARISITPVYKFEDFDPEDVEVIDNTRSFLGEIDSAEVNEQAGYTSVSAITGSASAISVTLPDGVTVSKIELFKAAAPTTAVNMTTNHYTLSGTTYTFKSDMVSAWTGGKLVFTYSDDKTDTVAIN